MHDINIFIYIISLSNNSDKYNIPDSLREPMIYLLRVVNSYYSNKIEGNPLAKQIFFEHKKTGHVNLSTELCLRIISIKKGVMGKIFQ